MSKIGGKPIQIPEGVKIEMKNHLLLIVGSKGEFKKEIPSEISIEEKDNQILVKFKGSKDKKTIWGTWRSHIQNMITGVNVGFEKNLKIEGVGWRADLEGKKLVLKVGFSHPVEVLPIEGIKFAIEKNIIKVSGISKELVGIMAANIRKIRPPEPYKGKGIRYVDEVIYRKVGKKAITAAK